MDSDDFVDGINEQTSANGQFEMDPFFNTTEPHFDFGEDLRLPSAALDNDATTPESANGDIFQSEKYGQTQSLNGLFGDVDRTSIPSSDRGTSQHATSIRMEHSTTIQDSLQYANWMSGVKKDAGDQRYQAAYLAAIGKSKSGPKTESSQSSSQSHTKACKGRQAHSTPPTSPTPHSSADKRFVQAAPRSTSSILLSDYSMFPDPEKDLSRMLGKYRKLHDQACNVIPRIPLASHRYWIAVLELGKSPVAAMHEKSFTWMKGNRLTTVKTVWSSYSTHIANGEFMLLMGWDKVGQEERMEELDYFNKKLVVFRCVAKEDTESRGMRISEGIVPPPAMEVIDLIDED